VSDMLNWLLRLDRLRIGEPGVEFGFAYELPLWGWVLVALGAAMLGWVCYRRLEGPRGARIALGTLRAMALVALAVILAGPRLLRPNEVEESDWVLVLVDRSASLAVRDVNDAAGTRISRDQQLKAALEASRPVWDKLAADRVVVWLGFDSTAWEAGKTNQPSGSLPEFGDPVGRRTDLNRALETALKRAAARPLSGVVVLSDGRSIEPPSRALMRRLEAEKVPVFTLALGSDRGVADLAIRHAEAPRTAFINDTVPVVVEVERLGQIVPGEPAPTATVELVDVASGEVLDTREVTFEQMPEVGSSKAGTGNVLDERRATTTLETLPKIAGRSNWSVRVKPSTTSTGAPAADLVEENNRVEVPLELVDRPLRVLYLDGYPRWEYRYLKNILIREPSVSSAVTLLAPGHRYIQEGTETLDALPNSPEEWANWDVLMLGDVYPGVFTNEQLTQIRDRVATSGLGLVWIGGEGAVPDAWRSTPLADLIPFTAASLSPTGTSTDARTEEWGEPVNMLATPAADSLGVLRLAETEVDGSWWPRRLSDPATGWSQLQWAQKVDRRSLKPTTEVLAVARPSLGQPADTGTRATAASTVNDSPLVMSMRFGAGRIVYVATDEIWRWRYGRGEFFTERFWLQIVRLLGRESVARSGKPAILQALPDRGETDRPIRIEVTLLDQSLVDAQPQSIKVRIRPAAASARPDSDTSDAANTDPGSDNESAELTLTPEAASSGTGGAGGTGGTGGSGRPTSRVFAATWIPTQAGRYRVEAIDPLLLAQSPGSGTTLSVGVQVWQPDDEMRQPQTDHPLLASLSQTTGGKILTTDELRQLPTLLPNRRLKLAGEPDIQTLWDTPLALIIVVLLLTAEWIGRRLLRLA